MNSNFVVVLKIVFTLAFSFGLASCATQEVTPTRLANTVNAGTAFNAAQNGIESGDLNRNVDACTDFYEFANGTWRAENPIPVAKTRWSRRSVARDTTNQRVQAILEELSRKKDWPTRSTEQLLGDHYASCMAEADINAAGLAPLAPMLAEIDDARTMVDVQRIIRRLHELAMAVPFGLSSAFEYHEPARTSANITAGGLGLPDRETYVKTEPRFVEALAKYREHVTKVLALGGMSAPSAGEAADRIITLERRLAEASLDSATASDQAATDHMMSFSALKQLVPHFDWETYFTEARLPRVDVNVAEPKFFQQLDKELNETPVATWKLYLKWQLLDGASPWLSASFVEASFDFREKYLNKVTSMKPRAERCVESVDALMGEALGKKYVERHFPPAAKAKAFEIAGNLLAALKDDVVVIPWMELTTKQTAIAKLNDTNLQLGYPDKWKSFSGLSIKRDAFWSNVAAGKKFNVDDDRQLIGKPTNRDQWLLAPSSSSAYIDLQLNKLVLPAGFLQPPYFNFGATDAVNYGAIGIGLAHDLTHAVDSTGSETDIAGRPQKWWTDADRKAFDQRAQCVVDQYESYFIEPGVHHDGRRVLSEAVADLGGVRVAYMALQKSMQSRPVAAIDGFTPEQQFFISWGQTAGAAMRLDAQRQLIKGDPHPVPKFNVIGPLSNSPAFQQAFSCTAGAAMVRPPAQRCAIW